MISKLLRWLFSKPSEPSTKPTETVDLERTKAEARQYLEKEGYYKGKSPKIVTTTFKSAYPTENNPVPRQPNPSRYRNSPRKTGTESSQGLSTSDLSDPTSISLGYALRSTNYDNSSSSSSDSGSDSCD